MMIEELLREVDRRAKALGLTDITLAKKAGLGRDAVRDIRRGHSTNPSHAVIAALAKALGCTVGDLTGERPAPRIARLQSDTVEINELDVHPQAGLGADEQGVVMEAHEAAAVVGIHSYPSASFREAYGIDPSRIKIIAVRGDSMEPKLWAGQRVMVDIGDKIPSPPGIFVVWDGLGLVIKRVEVIPGSEPLRVRISSDNANYQAYERLYSEAWINGRVIGIWART